MIETLEKKAMALGEDKKRLRQRLNEARDLLKDKYRVCFNKSTYSFERKRLISGCGRYALVWAVRDNPNEPANHINQQTSRGSVKLMRQT